MSLREEARNWYDGALVDLEEARSALAGGRYNWALFAAHQAVEKALKAAYMAMRRTRPPRPGVFPHSLPGALLPLGGGAAG